MTDKAHSLVNEGSRHAIHDLTYANASDRIAGINEGKGYNPPPSNKLWHIAKQDDDNSLWLCVNTSPLTWEQIVTSASGGNTDDTYNNFGANPAIITVDAAEGQTGNGFTWDMSGTSSDLRFFEVDLANGGDRTGGDAVSYHSGFRVVNGLDSFKINRNAANTIDVLGTLETMSIQTAGVMTHEAPNIRLRTLTDISSGNFVTVDSNAGKLIGASGTQSWMTILPDVNQSGTASYNALRINVTETSVGSGETNLMKLIVGGSTQFRIASNANTQIGTAAASYATGSGSLNVSSVLEAGGIIHAKNGVQLTTSKVIYNNAALYGSFDPRNAAQTVDSMALTVGTNSNHLLFIQDADKGYDFAHAAALDPTLIGHSRNQSTTEFWSLTHNTTDIVLSGGAGGLSLQPASGAVLHPNGAEATPSISFTSDPDTGFWRFGADDIRLSTGGTVHSVFNSGGLTVNTGVVAAQSGSVSNPGYAFASDLDTGFWLNGAGDMRVALAGAQHIVINSGGFALQGGDMTVPYGTAADPGYAFDGDPDTGLFRKTTNTIGVSAGGVEQFAVTTSGISLGDAKQILYNISPASDQTATGDTVSATVDTNATGIGAALYQASDGNWDEADADAIATMPCRALALESGTGTKLILRRGWIRNDTWAWTPGAPVYVSTTTGALTQTKPSGTGDQVQIVGYAETADILDFNPSTVIVEVA
jgi:hypothetical protein